MPWIGPRLDPAEVSQIAALAQNIALARARLDESDETTRRFIAPDALRQGGYGVLVNARLSVASAETTALSILKFHSEIDQMLLSALDARPSLDLDANVGPVIAALPDVPLSTNEAESFAKLYCAPVSEAIEAATEKVGMARYVRLNYHLIDRKLELLAIAFDRHPRQLARVRGERQLLPPDEPMATANDLLSYLVGVAFGRWDVRIGKDPSSAPVNPGILEPVRLCAPGMLTNRDGMPVGSQPDDYPIPLPPQGILVDEPGHVWDIEVAIRSAAAACVEDPQSVISEMLDVLGRASIREYLRKQFFKDHLARYSKSRRKAPIYWPLTVPSKQWGVWVYAPALTRETLYRVTNEAGRRERLAEEASTRLRREQHEGGAGRSARKVAEELENEETLAEELRRFRFEAERVAGLGWEPNLDDGIVLCAAPVADLFPSWTEAKIARDELRKGGNAWASVAEWADHL